MEFIKNLLENTWVQRSFWAIIVVLFSILVYHVIARVLKKKEQKSSKFINNKKNKTFVRMLRSIVRYSLIIVTTLMVLQIYGVDVTSMLAGVGIASVVIGFALQDSLKDIFRGFAIVSDGYYEIGDVIKYGENTGQVISVGLLTTKFKDMSTGNVVSVANRNIDQAEVVSNWVFVYVPMPYELPVKKSAEIAEEITNKIAKNDNVTSTSYLGITEFADSYVKHIIEVDCEPVNKLSVRRAALRTVADTLEAHKIAIPYPQLDVHDKSVV